MSPAPALSQLLAPCPLRWHQGISLRIASTLPIPSLPAVGPSIHSFIASIHRIESEPATTPRAHSPSCATPYVLHVRPRSPPRASWRVLRPSVVGKPHRSSSTSSSSPSRASPLPYSLLSPDIRHPTSDVVVLPPSAFHLRLPSTHSSSSPSHRAHPSAPPLRSATPARTAASPDTPRAHRSSFVARSPFVVASLVRRGAHPFGHAHSPKCALVDRRPPLMLHDAQKTLHGFPRREGEGRKRASFVRSFGHRCVLSARCAAVRCVRCVRV